MEIDIMDSLEDLGYVGNLSNEKALKKAIEEGVNSVDFIDLVAWLSNELQTLCNLESCINTITDSGDTTSVLIEISSFLKELNCPYQCLLEGSISDRFSETNNKVILLDFLCSELQAARVLKCKSQSEKNKLDIEMEASSTAICLTNLIEELDLDKDVKDNPINLLVEAEGKVKDLLSSDSLDLPAPLINEELSEDQWNSVQQFQKDMHEDYITRREMLLTRLDVTIQSFKWADRLKRKVDQIAAAFLDRRKELNVEPNVDISDLLAAREDLLIIEKTSSADLVKNTNSSLNKFLMPPVPDRGGRPNEQRPPKEMPNFQKRSAGGSSRQGDFGGGKKFKGGGKGQRRR